MKLEGILVKGAYILKAIKSNKKYLAASLTFLCAFLCVLLLRDHLLSFDLAVSYWVPTIRSDGATTIAIAVSYAFDTYSLLLASLAVGGYLFYKNYRPQSLLLLVVMGGNAAFVALFKTLVQSYRPMEGLIIDFSYSFPSGHTAGSIVFCGLLACFACYHWKTTRPRTLLIISAVVITSVVGFDRLYLNVHWFSDVLGGGLLGLFWLTLAIPIFKLLMDNEKQH
ncbi:MAG: phosphatase PAP2 family protein [Nitrososphaerota archaeon]|jgi:undecaprenyl-diphosphatase|nr:phosphatase PAP2 family protein [Nitrososphaerota archaeon]